MKKKSHILKVTGFVVVVLLLILLAHQQFFKKNSDTQITGINNISIVYFEYTNTNIQNGKDNGLEVRLKSRNVSSSMSKELLYLSGAKDMTYPASHYQLHEGILYFIDKNGGLGKVDNSLISVSSVNLNLKKDEFISDYFIQGNLIYYLVGNFCGAYMSACNNTLRVTNTEDTTTTSLATGIYESHISGFSSDGNTIVLSNSNGDGGCGFKNFSSFSLLKKVITSTNNFSFCEGDKAADAKIKGIDQFESSLYPKVKDTHYINIVNGKLLFTQEDKKVIDMITPLEVEGNSYSSLETIRAY